MSKESDTPISIYTTPSWVWSLLLAMAQCYALWFVAIYCAKFEHNPYNASEEKLAAYLAILFVGLVFMVQSLFSTPSVLKNAKKWGIGSEISSISACFYL